MHQWDSCRKQVIYNQALEKQRSSKRTRSQAIRITQIIPHNMRLAITLVVLLSLYRRFFIIPQLASSLLMHMCSWVLVDDLTGLATKTSYPDFIREIKRLVDRQKEEIVPDCWFPGKAVTCCAPNELELKMLVPETHVLGLVQVKPSPFWNG